MSSAFVLPPAEALRRDRAGGKGAVLAQLAGAFPVPPFFIIPPDAFDEAGLLPDARPAIADAASALGAGPFAVRSSGLEEDGAGAAHAGQFETQLNIEPSGLADAAHAVWRSGFAQSLADYRRARGLDPKPQPPAVVVQRMVAATAAGVAFTADPVSGARGIVVINAIAGLADRLVSGEEDGELYRLDRSGRILEAPASGAGVLSPTQARKVADLAVKAEAHYGAPQDVEWAIEDDTVWLLQARPITTLPPATAAADMDVSVWDNSNIVESYPGVVSPLTFSFARSSYGHVYRAFCRLMGVSEAVIAAERAAFDTMLGRVHGRVYYNLLGWYRLLSLFPGFASNRAFMEQMMGVGEPLSPALTLKVAPAAAPGASRLPDQLALARVALGLVIQGVILPRTIKRFYARLEQALARSDTEIANLPAGALAQDYRRAEASLLERWDAPLINDFLCMIAFGLSRRVMERWAGDAGLSLHADMMIGQGDIISAQPARLIRQMGEIVRAHPGLAEALSRDGIAAARANPDLGAQIDAYLARFGDRCTEELKLESPTLHDDPSALLAAVAAAGRGDARADRPSELLSPQARLSLLFKGRPVKRALASGLLRWTKARVRDRENLRFERTRLFGRVRRVMRAGGQRLAEAGVLNQADDVFFLTLEEWLGALEGGLVSRDLRGLVALRRREDAEDRLRPDPPERFEITGAFLPGLSALSGHHSDAGPEGAVRKGQACCAGVVTARVRVVSDPRTQALEPGEILVARHTDPGWIAVFANAAGVIAERGSLLSHSAIVAREMGVPCVVACKGVSTWLKTGDLVRLDGGAGLVERLEG
jgi:pyruvate,water dikinase